MENILAKWVESQADAKVTADITLGTAGATVGKIATDVGYTNFKFVDANGEEVESKYQWLLEKPNEWNPSWVQQVHQTVFSLEEEGNAVWWDIEGKELLYLDYSNLEPIFDSGKMNLTGFRTKDQNRKFYPIEELIHFKTLSHKGQTRLLGTPTRYNSVKDWIRTENLLQHYVSKEFEHEGLAPLVISANGSNVSNAIEALKNSIRKIWSKRQKMLIVEGDVKINPFTKGEIYKVAFKDGIDKGIESKICKGWYTSPLIISGDFNIGKDNSQTVFNSYYDGIINPICDILCEYINGYLESKGETAKLTFEPRKYVDAKDEMEYERFLWEKEDRENGVNQSETPQERTYPKPIGVKSLTPDYDMIWRQKDADLNRYAKSMKDDLTEYMEDLGKECLKNVDNVASKNLSGLFDIRVWVERLRGLVSPHVANIITETIDSIEIANGVYTDSEAIVLEQALDNMSVPVETIDKELNEVIKNTIRNNPDDVKEALREAIGNKFTDKYTKSRVDMIADNTAHTVQQHTTNEVIKEEGFGKLWLSMRDNKVRDAHDDLDTGEPIPGTEVFVFTYKEGDNEKEARADYPSEPSLPASQSINCRCQIIAVAM